MSRTWRVIFFCYLIVAFAGCTDKRDDIPVSDFFTSPEKTNFKISPNGEYVAFIKVFEGKKNVFIKKLDDGSEERATTFTDVNVNDYFWTYDDQILFSKESFGNKGPHKLFLLDVKTLDIRTLLTSEPNYKMRALNPNRFAPDVISVAMNKRDSTKADVYKLNVRTGQTTLYLANPGNVTEWYTEADGTIRLVKATEGADEIILFRPTETSPFKPIIRNNFRNSVRVIGFTGAKNRFYALSNVGRDKAAIVEINADNGKEERVLFVNDKADILRDRVEYLRSKYRLEYAGWEEDKPRRHFFDKRINEIYDLLTAQLAGNEVNITSRDTSEQKFIVTTSTDKSRGAVYLYDSKQNKLSLLNENSTLNPEEMCAMEPISYHASDGLLINGYITYPKGDRTGLPVVVIPHDGPFGQRDYWGYRAEIQFLASRGYAVLLANYRGSSGYGKAFYNAGFKEQGGKIQQDILDGVNWLIQNKIANPAKVAILGRGFGGFSALYGVSFYPHKYACAIAVDAPINAFTHVKEVPSYFRSTMQRRYEMYGDPEKDADRLRAISPVFNKSKVKAPILIFQAGMDEKLNASELTHYISDLKRQNVPVVFPGRNSKERWTGSTDSTRIEMYKEIEKFLRANMLAKP